MLPFSIRVRSVFLALTTLSVLVCSNRSFAQAAPKQFTNQDVILMIQAGLPESVILDKIKANPDHLDTSVDALVVLKKAGATDAELKATSYAVSVKSTPMGTTVIRPVGLAGGSLLHTAAGDPYLKFSQQVDSSFPDGRLSNTVFLVLYKGQPGLLVPSTASGGKYRTPFAFGNLIFTADKIIFDSFAEIKDVGSTQARIPEKLDSSEYSYVEAARSRAHNVQTFGKCFKFGDAEYLVGVPFFGAELHKVADARQYQSQALVVYVQSLIGNFPAVLQEFEGAAGINDPRRQLSSVALDPGAQPGFQRAYIDQLQSVLNGIPKSSGGGLNALLDVMAIATAGTSAIQQSRQAGNIAGMAQAQQQFDETLAYVANGNTAAAVQSSAPSSQYDDSEAGIQAAASQGQQQLANTWAQIQQQAARQNQQNTSQPASAGNRLCPNGKVFDAAAHCNCDRMRADYPSNCPASNGAAFPMSGKSGLQNYFYTASNLPSAQPPVAVQPVPAPTQDCKEPYIGGPCLNATQIQQWQAALNNAPSSVSPPTTNPTGPPTVSTITNFIASGPNIYVCPRGGNISTGYYAANDVWIGMNIPCTPGQQQNIVWSGGNGSGTVTSPTSGGNSSQPSAGVGCVNVTESVQMKSQWKTDMGSCGHEVVGWITNPMSQWVDCKFAFHKNAQWTDSGEGGIAPGKTQGGEFGGIWTCDADSSDMKYICFAGQNAADSNGQSCTANVTF